MVEWRVACGRYGMIASWKRDIGGVECHWFAKLSVAGWGWLWSMGGRVGTGALCSWKHLFSEDSRKYLVYLFCCMSAIALDAEVLTYLA